jgi:hypothetical protein
VAQQMSGALQGAAAGGAPPPMPNAGFFIGAGGQQQGPFDLAGLQAKLKDGSLSRGTLIWKQGMPNWVAAETVPELQSLFAGVPPPLPK